MTFVRKSYTFQSLLKIKHYYLLTVQQAVLLLLKKMTLGLKFLLWKNINF